MSRSLLVASALLCLVLSGVNAGSKTVRTPFGERPAECVVTVPHNSRVEEHPDGSSAILVTLESGESYRYDTPRSCMEDDFARRNPKRTSVGNHSGDCNSPPCTCDSLPCNNWIDNAGSMDTERLIGGMKAFYIAPETPKYSGDNQTLFWFIGAENTDGQARHGNPPPSGRAILQPVLTYDPSGWCNGTTGWCFASWYCCPANLTVNSPYIQNLQPGNTFLGQFNISESKDEFLIVSRNLETGVESNLKCPRQQRNFNWADITHEVYSVDQCKDFARGRMWFLDVELWDVNYTKMTPNWKFTSKKPCDGEIRLVGDRDFYIEHHDHDHSDTPSTSPVPPMTTTAAPTTSAPTGTFTQMNCQNSICSVGCSNYSFHTGVCLRVQGGGSAIVTCTTTTLQETIYSSSDCTGASQSGSMPLNQCLESQSGSYFENFCTSGVSERSTLELVASTNKRAGKLTIQRL